MQNMKIDVQHRLLTSGQAQVQHQHVWPLNKADALSLGWCALSGIDQCRQYILRVLLC